MRRRIIILLESWIQFLKDGDDSYQTYGEHLSIDQSTSRYNIGTGYNDSEILTELRRENQKLCDENDRLKKQINDYKKIWEDEKKNLENRIRNLEDSIEEGKRFALKSYEKRLNDALSERDQSNARLAQLSRLQTAQPLPDVLELQERLSRVTAEVEMLKKKARENDAALKTKDGSILQAKQDLSSYRKLHAEDAAKLAAQDGEITRLRGLLEVNKAEIAAAEATIRQQKGKIDSLEKLIEELRRPKEPEPDILLFNLAEVAPPFSGSPESMLKKLDNAAAAAASMADYLKKASYRSAPVYLANITRLAEGLTKLREKAAAKAQAGDDDLSEWLAEKYLSVFARNLFNTVVPGISRGLKDNREFYVPFLRLLNKFLSTSGFYTRKVTPGKNIGEEDYLDMDFVIEATQDPEKNKRIHLVERLPYYIKYNDYSGEVATFHHPGRMVLLKAGNE